MDDNLTAYCGLYCPDCIPSHDELFALLEKIDVLLEDLKLEEYARLKSKDHPILSQYPVFQEVLREIKLLRCHNPCRRGGGKEGCAIRSCCDVNNLNGCWECDVRGSCDLLQPLIKVHHNLPCHYDLIREHGIDDWVKYRKAHYKWQEEDKA